MDPIVRPIEANADEGTLGWWSSTKSAQTASGTIEVLLSANTDDSAGAGSDDSLLSRLDFPSTTLSPVSGVEPQLGAASGILAGLGTGAPTAWENSPLPAGAGTIFAVAPPSAVPMDRGFVPLTVGQASGASPGTSTAGTARPLANHAPVLATRQTGPRVATASTQPASSTGGGIPAPAEPTGELGANPFIVTHNAADILPQLYASTADNPDMGLVQVPQDAQGQNPMSQGFSAGGVRYADGTLQLSQTDMSSTAFASQWGESRSWTNNAGMVGTNTLGNSWMASQAPWLQSQDSGNTLAVIGDGTTSFLFDYNTITGAWIPRHFLQLSLTDNATAQEFDLVDPAGRTLKFYDYNRAIPISEQGTFKGLADTYGNTVSVVSHTSSGAIQEVQSSYTQGSTTVTESYLNTYYASGFDAGLLQNETLRRQTNGGSWSTVQQTVFVYYDGTTGNGNAGDLETATVEDGSGNVLGTSYYRYYVSTGNGGYQHGLKYSLDPRSYARAQAALGNVLTATDTALAPYAQYYFQYDTGQHVTEEVVQGDGSSLGSSNIGLGTYTYTFSTSGNTQAYNNWNAETVVTLPDSSTDTVFTNAYGEVMLTDHYDPSTSQHWDTFNEYDSSGRIILTAAPSAVTGYSTSYADLLHYSNEIGR